MKIKVVLDTNVLISFFIGGKMLDLTKMVRLKGIEILCNEHLLCELEKVLSRHKFQKYLALPVHEYTSFFRMICTEIETEEVFSECRDPKDNFLFDIAEQGGADYIVSGDNDVLAIDSPKLRTITMGDFLILIGTTN